MIRERVGLRWKWGTEGTAKVVETSRVCSLSAKYFHMPGTHHLEILSIFSSPLLSMSHLKFHCFISLLFWRLPLFHLSQLQQGNRKTTAEAKLHFSQTDKRADLFALSWSDNYTEDFEESCGHFAWFPFCFAPANRSQAFFKFHLVERDAKLNGCRYQWFLS